MNTQSRIEVRVGIFIDREGLDRQRCDCDNEAEYRVIADDGQFISFYYHCHNCIPNYLKAAIAHARSPSPDRLGQGGQQEDDDVSS